MKSTTDDPRDDRDLIANWPADCLEEDDSTLLQDRLRTSAKLRASFLAECQLDAALREVAGQLQETKPQFSAPGLPSEIVETEHPVASISFLGWRHWRLPLLLAGLVAACFLMMLGWGLMSRLPITGPQPFATIESVQGVVAYRDGDGERFLVADSQPRIGAGMLLLDGESAAVQVRFLDGSLLSMLGPAEASMEASAVGRRIKLRNGLLTAEVQPQARNGPLFVETPTAVVEVLGTVFSLSAGAERTQVEVDSGKVRLERLADGAKVEIAPQESCVATFDTSESLRSIPNRGESRTWRRDFDQVPPENWKGDWIPASFDRPGVMRAVPCVVGRRRHSPSSYSPIIHHGVSVRPKDTLELGRVTLNSRLRFTLSLSEPARLQVIIGVQKSNGRFGGNFELLIESKDGAMLPSGLRHFDVRLSDFEPKMPLHPHPEEGDRPYLLLITTLTRDVGMELSEISIAEEGFHP